VVKKRDLNLIVKVSSPPALGGKLDRIYREVFGAF